MPAPNWPAGGSRQAAGSFLVPDPSSLRPGSPAPSPSSLRPRGPAPPPLRPRGPAPRLLLPQTQGSSPQPLPLQTQGSSPQPPLSPVTYLPGSADSMLYHSGQETALPRPQFPSLENETPLLLPWQKIELLKRKSFSGPFCLCSPLGRRVGAERKQGGGVFSWRDGVTARQGCPSPPGLEGPPASSQRQVDVQSPPPSLPPRILAEVGDLGVSQNMGVWEEWPCVTSCSLSRALPRVLGHKPWNSWKSRGNLLPDLGSLLFLGSLT